MHISELTVTERTLSNGLRLVTAILPHLHRVYLQAQLKIGSRYENEANNGISHFLEHMLFRGTPSFPTAVEEAHAFERLGSSLDASTAADQGTLALAIPPECVDESIRCFSEAFQSPLFTAIELERGIVREEILESLDSKGQDIDPENLLRSLSFADHPLAMTITGSLERLEDFDVAQLAAFHRQFYVASNTTIAIVGPGNPEAYLDQLEAHFSELITGSPAESPPPPAQEQLRYQHVEHEGSQTSVRLGFRGPSLNDADRLALELMMRIIDDGMSTRLYHQICDSRGLCYDAHAGYESYVDTGLIEFSGDCSADNVPALIDAYIALFTELVEAPPSEIEMEIAKKRLRWDIESSLESGAEICAYLAEAKLFGRPMSLWNQVADSALIDADRIQSVAKRWLKASGLSVVTVGTLKSSVRKSIEKRLQLWQNSH